MTSQQAEISTSNNSQVWANIFSTHCFLTALLLDAGVHVQYLGYFRALSRRFSYAIYYKINGDLIEIWRVLDCRKNPKRTKTALRS